MSRPTKERMAKSGPNVHTFIGDEGATVRFEDGILARLMLRNKITGIQHNAGELFYTHFYHAGISQDRARAVLRDRVDCEGGVDETESQLYHKQVFNSALKSLDASVVGVVIGVAIDNRSLEQVGGFTGYKTKKDRTTAAMTCLRIGLDQLSEHFGLIQRRRRQYVYEQDGYRTEVREDLWEKRVAKP